MIFKNLISKFFLAIMLTIFLAMPKISMAADLDYRIFSEIETKKILQLLPQELNNNWIYNYVNGYSDPTEKTVLSFIRTVTTFDLWNYLFGDLPIEAMVNISKELVTIAQILNSENPVGGIISLMESQTVDQAVKTATDYILQKQMKVAFGAMKVNYNTGTEKVNTTLQYLMVYKPIDEKSGELIIRMYSVDEIVPPVSHGSIGLAVGFVNDMSAGQKIPPFIAEIRGTVKDSGFLFDRDWVETPNIVLSFPKKVPDFKLKPKDWQDKYINEPIARTLDSVSSIIKIFNPSGGQIIDYVAYDENKKQNTRAINLEISKIANNEPLVIVSSFKKENQSKINFTNDKEIEIENKNKTETKNNIERENKTENDQSNDDNLSEEEIIKAFKDIFAELEKRLSLKNRKEENKEEEPKNKDNKDNKDNKQTNDKSICLIQNANFSKQKRVVFNEIAWMGTATSASDEWIELKNISFAPINLAGWSLINESRKIDIVFGDNQAIGADGLFLLERTDDNTVPNQQADLIYSGAMSNNNEALYLFNEKCELEGVVKASPDWAGGDAETKRTMEKNNDGENWYTFGGSEREIMGTPKEKNSNTNWQKPITGSGGGGSNSSGSSSNSGNSSSSQSITYCPQSNLSIPTHEGIVINEIAWMGTATSASDEWIELKNISDEVINLQGWQLIDKDNQIQISLSSTDSILAHGFYLLERTDDNSVPNLSADKIYTGALSDTDESLRLFNPNCVLIDEVVATTNWTAGDKTNKKTMERNIDLASWHSYSNSSPDEASGLYGTPQKENSQYNSELGDEEPGDEEPGDEEDEEEEDDLPEEIVFSDQSITDLKADSILGIRNSLTLSWSELDQAESYEIYYSINEPINEGALINLTDYEDIEIIKEAGHASAIIKDLYWDSNYYFAIKAKNLENELSLLSNSIQFSIGSASPEITSVYGNNYTGKLLSAGPMGGAEATLFLQGENDSQNDEDFTSPPVIDENGIIYVKAKIDNKQGLYAFDKNGIKKWVCEYVFNYGPPVIGKDGTIYSLDFNNLYAISPNGKIKWQKTFSNIYGVVPYLSPIGSVYLIVSIDGSLPKLVKIEDNRVSANQINLFDFSSYLDGKELIGYSPIVFSSSGNLYFSLNNYIFAFNNSGQKIGEKKIEVIFGEDYVPQGNEANYIKQVFLSSDEQILFFNSIQGFYSSNDNRQNKLYALSANNLDSDPLWIVSGGQEGDLMALSDTELYYKQKSTGDYGWFGVAIRAINLSDGSDKWGKSQSFQFGPPSPISLASIDNRNYLYFSYGSQIYGFDSNQITDDKWETGKIFQGSGASYYGQFPLAIGNGAIYLPRGSGSNLFKISF